MCTLNHARTLITYFKTLLSIYRIAYHIFTRIVKYQVKSAVTTKRFRGINFIAAILRINTYTLCYHHKTASTDDIG